mmetsp:Transcript_19876/g.24533  ORF Transcript_19876/g.24533 Transcript_19876/m.24533 type:complete len:440 (+) Transcript_19876:115-1434(+)|eukprot:CAMPEP_0172498018 /NCGR_PEP_ID=MMETSP1066-20121228/108185_1 /TAXON_ID=671091 /ORGANISM="Coscinodiscus wailesii, Strain CCMP2513" /LENGTH=439 /DNA_ID=CAMNT_0013271113 /DNA_START=115 /DNA_END=1431 /DNA_ORIENTATION=-
MVKCCRSRTNGGVYKKTIEEVSEDKIKATRYTSESHRTVLTQMAGSVWPDVLPFCIVNTLLTYLIHYLRRYHDIDLTFNDKGHSFMSMLVSFLIVTRSNIAYSRLMEANTYLINCMRCCRELVQHTVAFTRHESGTLAKEWRTQVARRTIVLLQTTVAVLEYQSKRVDAWKTLELSRDEKKALLAAVGKSNERAPIVLTLFLRSSIAAHTQNLEKDIHVNKELYLMSFVTEFSKAYHGLMQLMTTPFPFPLVQMARTFLFFWIFSLPFALVAQYDSITALLIINFILTYGFVGLEYVSIQMDDPFGDDPCDFDAHGISRVVIDDIYIAIYDIDGKDAANDLKQSVLGDDDEEKVQKKRRSHTRTPSADIMSQSLVHKTRSSVIGVGRLLRNISGTKDVDTCKDGEHSQEPGQSKQGHYKLPPSPAKMESKETTRLLDKW